MKKLDRNRPTEGKTQGNNLAKTFLDELAERTSQPRTLRIPNYVYDERLGKMTFVVQKEQLHPLLKHLRSKNLEAWSCFSNVVMGEIIVETTPEAGEQALADFMGRFQPQRPF